MSRGILDNYAEWLQSIKHIICLNGELTMTSLLKKENLIHVQRDIEKDLTGVKNDISWIKYGLTAIGFLLTAPALYYIFIG